MAMYCVDDLRRASKSEDVELAVARAAHEAAWWEHCQAGRTQESFQAVRAANERIGAALMRIMNANAR